MHAVPLFEKEHNSIYEEWYEKSNHIAVLSVADEDSLKDLIFKARIKDIKCSVFTEPDLDNQITSVAFEPCEETCKLCSSLPLALKEYGEIFKQLTEKKEVANGN